jgi:hypothetical protein
MRSAREVHVEILSLDSDIRALARSNHLSMWFVNVVLANFDLLHTFDKKALHLSHEHVELKVQISDLPFNKFVFVREKLDDISLALIICC